MFRKVMVAIDGTACSTRALKTAIGLARDEKAALEIVHVVEESGAVPVSPYGMAIDAGEFADAMIEALREQGRRTLAKAKKLAEGEGVTATATLVPSMLTSVSEQVLTRARRSKADLLVLGTHGRRGVRRLLMGSDAEAIVREARIPVMLVKGTR